MSFSLIPLTFKCLALSDVSILKLLPQEEITSIGVNERLY